MSNNTNTTNVKSRAYLDDICNCAYARICVEAIASCPCALYGKPYNEAVWDRLSASYLKECEAVDDSEYTII